MLELLQAGVLGRDSGATSVLINDPDFVTRQRQRVEIYRNILTLEGKRGILTWKVVRGTCEYAQIVGGDRTATAGLNHGHGAWSVHEEGFLILP